MVITNKSLGKHKNKAIPDPYDTLKLNVRKPLLLSYKKTKKGSIVIKSNSLSVSNSVYRLWI
jgi:hypothetical protein